MQKMWLIFATVLLITGCASMDERPPLAIDPIIPSPGDSRAVEQVIILLDCSSSMNQATKFPLAKSLAESIISAMPEGNYLAGMILFGGKRYQVYPLSVIDRLQYVSVVRGARPIGGITQLDGALEETRSMLYGHPGRTAVILITDGRPVNPTGVIDSGRLLIRSQGRGLCLHTIHIGDVAGSGDLLSELAARSPCGSYRHASDVSRPSDLHAFVRSVFFTE